jgi:hypothetical protein
MSGPRYAELQVTSHFSFLRGASSCEELFATAAILGIEALAVVDCNSLAGVVRAHEAAKTTGVRPVVGCRLDLSDGMSVLVYPTDRAAYSRLCRLLSLGKKRAGKAKCDLAWADLVAYGEGLIAVLVPDEADQDCALRLRRLREAFGDRAYVALSLRRRPNDQLRLFDLSNLATSMRVPTIARAAARVPLRPRPPFSSAEFSRPSCSARRQALPYVRRFRLPWELYCFGRAAFATSRRRSQASLERRQVAAPERDASPNDLIAARGRSRRWPDL